MKNNFNMQINYLEIIQDNNKKGKVQSFDCIDFVLTHLKNKITRLCRYVLYCIAEVLINASSDVPEAPPSKTQVAHKSSGALQKRSVGGFSCAVRGFISGELLALLEVQVANAPSHS